jgi:uncharacterized protein (PEP-CTERM system associated)
MNTQHASRSTRRKIACQRVDSRRVLHCSVRLVALVCASIGMAKPGLAQTMPPATRPPVQADQPATPVGTLPSEVPVPAGRARAQAAPAVPDESIRPQHAWIRQVSVDTMFTATDNGNFGSSTDKRSEFISSIRPALHVQGISPKLALTLDASADFLSYAHDTQPDDVLPALRAVGKATLIPGWLFVDGLADVRQTEDDAFGVRATDGGTANSVTNSTYRVSPYLQHDLDARTTLLLKHDEAWLNQAGEDADDLRSRQSVARIDYRPAPIGGLVEVSQLDNEYAQSQSLKIDALRAGATIALPIEVVAGLLVGRERTQFSGNRSQTNSLYGLTVQWDPTPRTELIASAEHRFFGTGGRLEFRHRTLFTALSIQVAREPVTAATARSALTNGVDLTGYLDAIASRSTSDQMTRALQVQSQLTSLGLQASIPGGSDVVAGYAQLQTGANMTWVLSLPRTTFTLSAYGQKFRQLTLPNMPPPVAATLDMRQSGAFVEVSRRITSQTSLDARLNWSHTRGLGARSGDETRESDVRVGTITALSPRSQVMTGILYRQIESNVASVIASHATSVFAGLNHRF